MVHETISDRHASALTKAMNLSRERQELSARIQQVEQEMLKTAGQIDLLETLLKEAKDANA